MLLTHIYLLGISTTFAVFFLWYVMLGSCKDDKWLARLSQVGFGLLGSLVWPVCILTVFSFIFKKKED